MTKAVAKTIKTVSVCSMNNKLETDFTVGPIPYQKINQLLNNFDNFASNTIYFWRNCIKIIDSVKSQKGIACSYLGNCFE